MKLNSIIFKMMTPLVIVTTLVVSVTFFVTQIYIKKVIENVFINFRVHHLEEAYTLKIENILVEIKSAGVAITSSKDVQNFAFSKDAEDGKISQDMKKKLSEIKKLYKLNSIYIAQAQSKNYYNENGFVRVVDPSKKESEWFSRTLNGKKNFFINTDSDFSGHLYIWLDAVLGSTNNPIALVGGGVDVSNIFELALKNFRKDCADVIIINDANLVHASSKNSNLLNVPLRESGFSKEKILAIEDARKSGKNLVEYTVDGELRDLLFIPIEELKWNVIIDFSKEEFLESLGGVYDRVIAGNLILIFLLLLVGSLTFIYLVLKPLKKISSAVSDYDYKSDFDLKDCKSMGYEFDMICSAFKKSSTLLRKTLDEHKYNEELLTSIINAADDCIIYKDINSMYLGGNSAFEHLNSKNIEEIIGKTDDELYSAEVANYNILTDKQAIERKETILVEEKYQKDDGSFAILQTKKSPIYDNRGEVRGVIVVARDMTIIKEMEHTLLTLNATLEKGIEEKTLELQTANETLEENIINLKTVNSKLYKAKVEALQAAQARSNFITGMSHELRTPLNAIINFTDQVIEDFDEMLQDKGMQEDTKIFMQRVLVNSKHLLNLINDLLEFTKAEAGKIDYNIEKYDLNIIAKMAYNNTYSLLNGTDVKFNLNLYEIPLIATVDSRRFLQILLNLLSNSIKFTQKGEIELRSFEENGHVIVEVEDSGKGIPQDKQSTIFEPFMQVNNTDNGTGLGLGLAKKMCDDMNIIISFSSIEGEGTIFRLVVKKNLMFK